MTLRLRRLAQRAAFAVAPATGIVLATSALMVPAQAQPQPARTGSWIPVSFEESLSAPCGMANVALENTAQLNAYVERHGTIKFIVQVDDGLWRDAETKPEFLVDGVPAEVAMVRPFGRDAIEFVSSLSGERAGTLLGALETGERAVVQANGRRFTFDLTGTKAAMATLDHCHDTDGSMPRAGSAASTPLPERTDSAGPVSLGDGSATPTPSSAVIYERTFGEWNVGSRENPFGARCLMGQLARMSLTPGSSASLQDNPRMMLGAFETMGFARFAVIVGTTDLSFDVTNPPAITLIVDGKIIETDTPEVVNGRTLVFRDYAGASVNAIDPPGSRISLRNGMRAEVSVAGYRASFDLKGSAAALGALTECSSDDGPVAQAELEREIEEEIEGDRMEAGLPTLGEASPPSEVQPANPAGLGGILERYANVDATPVAQYQCAFSGLDLFGIPDQPGSVPEVTTFTIRDDGSLLLNGTAVAASEVRRAGGRIASAAYPAGDIVKAGMGAAPERSPLANQSARQDAAYQAAHTYFRDQIDQLFAQRRRFLVVGIETDMVGAFDLGSNSDPLAQTTPDCVRLP